MSLETNNSLSLPFTKDEVKTTLFDLNPSKAPGPDGFTALFYQNAWDIIGEEVTTVILDVLNNKKELKEWNPTIVTLIPKSKEAKSIKEFRPISLCNASYKIIARAITNRFKYILGSIIDPQ